MYKPLLERNVYNYVNNKNGRRILVVNQLLEVDKVSEIAADDFDAIYINIAHRAYEENRLIVRWTSPIRSKKCYLKPRFATSSLEEFMHFAAYLIDGFCMSPFDDVFAEYIETIYNNIEKFSIRRAYDTSQNTTVKFLANIIKFDISRGRITYANATIRGMAEGYTETYMAWYDNQETLQYEERTKFNVKMEELGFAEKHRFKERVHVCPECGHSHLLFIECCPKCGSANIKQESIIHHFRCANVSPESTYDYDGQLRCPKCKRVLRHIGVDYDRPATMYSCGNCTNTFLTASMKVFCSNCREESTPGKLIPVDVWEYRLTKNGIQAFATDSALMQIESRDIFSGHSTYEDFITSITSFSLLPSYSNSVLVLRRYRINYNGEDEHWRLFDLMRSVISKITIMKIAQRGENLYMFMVLSKSTLDTEYKVAVKNIDQLFNEYSGDKEGFNIDLIGEYKYEQGENVDDFISTITENDEPEESIIEQELI